MVCDISYMDYIIVKYKFNLASNVSIVTKGKYGNDKIIIKGGHTILL